MGTKAAEALDVSFDELPNYLHAKHSVYMEFGSETYYLTDVNDRYWRRTPRSSTKRDITSTRASWCRR